MDTEVVTSLISALGAVASAAIGYLLSIIARPKEKKVNVLESQMIHLFEPLVIMLEFRDSENLAHLLSSIEILFTEQYRLLPGKYMEEYKRIVSLDEIVWDDFKQIRKMAMEDYDSARLIYGYPNSVSLWHIKDYLHAPLYLWSHWINEAYAKLAETGLICGVFLLAIGIIVNSFGVDFGASFTNEQLAQIGIMVVFFACFLWGRRKNE